MTTRIRNWNPAEGFAFQGDVALIPVPDGIAIATDDEVKPSAGRLILQEGEVTGHHHKIVLDPTGGRSANFARSNAATATTADPMQPILDARRKARGPAKTGTARIYRDPAAAAAMVRADILARADLGVGFLVVEGGPVVVTHEEHDGVRVPAGRYYVGRQVESVGAEERVVQD